MELFPDFADIVQLLNKHEVLYMVVGGYAVAAHGRPRFTEDFDIWIKPDHDNAIRVWKVITDFGFAGINGLSIDDFTNKETVVQFGFPPCRIDFLASISGVDFDDAYQQSIVRKIGNWEMRFIGLEALIENKLASGRDKDLLDAKDLKIIQLKLKKKKSK